MKLLDNISDFLLFRWIFGGSLRKKDNVATTDPTYKYDLTNNSETDTDILTNPLYHAWNHSTHDYYGSDSEMEEISEFDEYDDGL